jgi:hypothetical protein
MLKNKNKLTSMNSIERIDKYFESSTGRLKNILILKL